MQLERFTENHWKGTATGGLTWGDLQDFVRQVEGQGEPDPQTPVVITTEQAPQGASVVTIEIVSRR